MVLASAEQMRLADRRAIEDYGISSILLMERAAAHIAEAAKPYLHGGIAVALCGSGNNGGDGIGAAATLLRMGYPARALLAGDRAHMTPDALEMERQLVEAGGQLETFDPEKKPFTNAAVIIDALFGIGLNKPVTGNALAAIRAMNAADVPVVAADIPSGVAADTGQILGDAVKADVTVTFSRGKTGHFVEPGCVCTGKLLVKDIGIPAEALEDCRIAVNAIMDGEITLPRRNPLSHKGDFGKALIVGGAVGYTGAPCLCANAAVRAGAGLVYLGVPEDIYPITAVKTQEAMPFPLPDSPAVRDILRSRGEACDVCAIGPGMGKSRATRDMVAIMLTEPALREKPLVLDADALNVLEGEPELLHAHAGPLVLTPHMVEFQRIGGVLTGDRVDDARRFAQKHDCILLLKGHRCIAAFPDGHVEIATHGNPGMAKGGSGDALTGILTALLGQFPPEQAVPAAMHLHALSGDLCRDRLGEYAMTASDLIETLPEAALAMAE